MIKKITAAVLLCFMLSGVSAQTKSVDLDNFRCTLRYRTVPERPLKPIVANYFCMFKCSPWLQGEIGTSRVMDAMEITGLEKVYTPMEADIYYQIDMSDLRIVKNWISERKSERKGKVTFYYRAEAEYTFSASCSVIRPDDYATNGSDILFRETVLGGAIGTVSKEVQVWNYHSNEFNSRKDAENFWNKNRVIIVRGLIVEHVAEAVRSSNLRLSKIFGFPEVQTSFNLIITDENKHYENDAFRANTERVKNILQSMTPDRGFDIADFSRETDYYLSVVDRYNDLKHKADIRLRHAALHNLFSIYYWADDMENAAKYAQLLLRNGFEKNKAEADLRLISATENEFRRSGIATRHFSVYDLYSYDGHGNDSRYDPRGQTGTYLNNGYYDGYGQGWHDGYRDRYRNEHGYGGGHYGGYYDDRDRHGDGHGDGGHGNGHGDGRGNDGHGDNRQDDGGRNDHYHEGSRNGTGNGSVGSSGNTATQRPTQSNRVGNVATPQSMSGSQSGSSTVTPSTSGSSTVTPSTSGSKVNSGTAIQRPTQSKVGNVATPQSKVSSQSNSGATASGTGSSQSDKDKQQSGSGNNSTEKDDSKPTNQPASKPNVSRPTRSR